MVPDQTGFACDFETDRNVGLYCYTAQDGGDRNWTPAGARAVLANVTEQAHGGTHSLRYDRPHGRLARARPEHPGQDDAAASAIG